MNAASAAGWSLVLTGKPAGPRRTVEPASANRHGRSNLNRVVSRRVVDAGQHPDWIKLIEVAVDLEAQAAALELVGPWATPKPTSNVTARP